MFFDRIFTYKLIKLASNKLKKYFIVAIDVLR